MTSETTGYVVFQYGCAVFGAGTTQEEAWADAAQWLDEPLDDDTTETPRVYGAIYCLPATPRLIDAVREQGGQVVVDVEEWPTADLAAGD